MGVEDDFKKLRELMLWESLRTACPVKSRHM